MKWVPTLLMLPREQEDREEEEGCTWAVGDQGSRSRETISSLLECGDLHSPPHELPACRPGVAQLSEENTHGKCIGLHSYLMGGEKG